ncbi:hypothetical protein C8024_19525 [Sphingopyxis sp. BSNA05]|uniref:hypothetical protein n=1 Tax=Sphingopyxis sp. BSNA05 TaxID=1236614 RepID=UPI001C25876E|nr:hypothetical protein [Sphingopyxis sp. BSNA05]NRD91163.1 hypothetical protein [Sphingopyxis sp. BSNA05]
MGSALYGPVLGVFLIAILWRRRTVLSSNIGFLAGVALNLYFWQFQPGLFWMWWNLIGLLVTLSVAILLSLASGKMPLAGGPADWSRERVSPRHVFLATTGLTLFVCLIFLVSLSIERF